MPRTQRIAILASIGKESKSVFLGNLEMWKNKDPGMMIYGQETIFPVLVIETTPELAQEIGECPEVVSIAEAPQIALCDAEETME